MNNLKQAPRWQERAVDLQSGSVSTFLRKLRTESDYLPVAVDDEEADDLNGGLSDVFNHDDPEEEEEGEGDDGSVYVLPTPKKTIKASSSRPGNPKSKAKGKGKLRLFRSTAS